MNVYVMAGGRRHVKIGFSQNVEKRRQGVQTGCPFTVRIVQSWRTTRAVEIERKAHQVLARYRWAGEWFDIPQRAAALTVGMLVAATPCRGDSDKPLDRAVVFCRGCSHSAVLRFVPPQKAKLRCTKCQGTQQVHVVEVVTPADAARA